MLVTGMTTLDQSEIDINIHLSHGSGGKDGDLQAEEMSSECLQPWKGVREPL